jgi:vancomycin resistance protein YoaR
MAARIDRGQRDASIRLRGLNPVIVRGSTGRSLDREAAARQIVGSLVALERAESALPIRIEQPEVTAADLQPTLTQAKVAVSGPVRVSLGPTRWRIPRWRIATMLDLPKGGETGLTIGGAGANRFFTRFRKEIDQPAADARFVVLPSDNVTVAPAKPGLQLDVEAARKAILAAAFSTTDRVAKLTVEKAAPERTTREARAMGITGRVAGYTTYYGGDPNRIHNVQLVAHLVDGAMIAPGATFSFNGTTGERSPDKGFLEAPVIINGELETGIGGGVCQVSTTVFNAAFEAGLPITSRTNHALYISHYPQGRDATVNYPDTDLKFVNDTGKWLLLRTFVGSSALTVKLYGTPQGRRVEAETTPLEETGPPTEKRIPDPSIWVGEKVLEESGQPSRRTSVTRRVYGTNGKLLSEATWSSFYRAEPNVYRVGTKPRPKEPPPTKPKKKNPPPPPPTDEATPQSSPLG